MNRGGQAAATLLAGLILSGCASSKPRTSAPPDPELSRLSSLARASFDKGSALDARRLYEQALTRALATDRSLEIGVASYNLAVCLFAAGDYEAARRHVRVARQELTAAGHDAADTWLLEARLARREGEIEEVRGLAEQGLAALGKRKAPELRAGLLLLRAAVACDAGDALAARIDLTAARNLARHPASALAAEFAEIEGRILLIEGQPILAAREFDREASLLQESGIYGDMALALVRAGQSYYEAQDWGAACDRYFRAARSLYGQGNPIGALKICEESITCAENLGDDLSIQRGLLLFEEIRASVDAKTPKSPPSRVESPPEPVAVEEEPDVAEAVAAEPEAESPDYRTLRGRAYTAWHQRDFAAGAQALREVIERFPKAKYVTSGEAQYWLCANLGRAGSYDQAIREAEVFLKTFPSNPRAPQVEYFRGLHQKRAGDVAGARRSWEHVAMTFPGNPVADQARRNLEKLESP